MTAIILNTNNVTQLSKLWVEMGDEVLGHKEITSKSNLSDTLKRVDTVKGELKLVAAFPICKFLHESKQNVI